MKNETKYTGKSLIDAGYKPGTWFGSVLEGLNNGEIRWEEVANYVPVEPDLIPLQSPCETTYFLEPQNELEAENLASVEATIEELAKTPTIRKVAIMPDACPAGPKGTIPVGGVVKAENAVHPGMHSADICCSLFMTQFETEKGNAAKKVLDATWANTHFGPGGRDDHSKLPLELEERIRANPYTKEHLDRAKKHLATQGDGNHFAFVGTSDQNGLVTLITHHGSRGFGAKVYQEGMKVAERFRQQLSPETLKQNAWIPMNTEEGRLYWEALQIVRAWTKLNHATIHRLVTVATEYRVARTIWNEHNFVFERKGFYYHGKGATPMWNHAPKDEDVQVDRIIPLNMAAPILLIRGGLKDAMEFSPHGAGRNMSRTAHAKSGVADFTRETAGLDIRSWSGKADESELPSAYKEANAIEREIAKHKLGKLSERILPYGSIMAGKSKHARRRRKR